MSVYTIENINYFYSGKTQDMLNLTILDKFRNKIYVKSFVTNRDENDLVMNNTESNNYSSYKDVNSDSIIHAIFDFNDVCIKNNILKANYLSNINKSDNFVDIYLPTISESNDKNTIINTKKYKNYMYSITYETKNAPVYKLTDLDETRYIIDSNSKIENSEYKWELKSDEMKLNLYQGRDSIQNSDLSSYFEPEYIIKNMSFNYICEIPLESDTFNNFEYGDMFADFFTCKNMLNSDYSMDMPEQTKLTNTRKYIELGSSTNGVYLKYFDDIEYNGNIFGNTISMDNGEKIEKNYNFQNIEMIKSINRFEINTKHKSNVYSVKIKNINVDTLNTSNKYIKSIAEKIKLDIRNNIRDITKNVCPVNTELFNVYID